MSTIFTDLEVEAAARKQRLDIQCELLKLRLEERCFLALKQNFLQQGSGSQREAHNLDHVGSNPTPATNCGPIATEAGLESSKHVADACGMTVRAGHQPPSISPGGSGAQLQSGPPPAVHTSDSAPPNSVPVTNNSVRPAAKALTTTITAQEHNRFPKGRW